MVSLPSPYITAADDDDDGGDDCDDDDDDGGGGGDGNSLWRSGSEKLRALDNVVVEHGSKYRICLADPLAWAPCKEFYQETREATTAPP